MKYLCLLTTATLFVVFASLTYAAPTKSEETEMEGWRDTFRAFAPHLKKAAKFYLDNYGEVEAQDLSTAELQQWGSILLKALPHVAPVMGDLVKKGLGWDTAAQDSQTAKAQILGTVLGSVLPFLLNGMSNGNGATVNRKDALIQEILQAQQDELLSNDDLKGKQLIQNLLAGQLKGAAEEQGMEYMPDIGSLSQEAQAQFIGSMLGALTGGLGKLFG